MAALQAALPALVTLEASLHADEEPDAAGIVRGAGLAEYILIQHLTSQESLTVKSKNETIVRPIYFNVVFWGERFRDYFTNFLLASMLSPNNLPRISLGRENKFLIATTDEDWEILRSTASFQRMCDYLTPVHLRINFPPPGVSACQHMGVGHKMATEMAFHDKCYFVALTPDLLVSDGTLQAIDTYRAAGYEVVLTAAHRFAEERLFEGLQLNDFISRDNLASRTGQPLTATARQLLAIGLESFHTETLSFHYESPEFSLFPVGCYWEVDDQGSKGVVLHTFSWAAFLLDYSIVPSHDTSCLETWTFDGNYVNKNFSHSRKIHIVQDSDDILLISWTPLNEGTKALHKHAFHYIPVVSDFIKMSAINDIYNNPIMDNTKKYIFRLPVYWHSGDLTSLYYDKEREALQILERAISPSSIWKTSVLHILKMYIYLRRYIARLPLKATIVWGAIVGDEFCRQWLRWRYQRFLGQSVQPPPIKPKYTD